MYTAILRHIGEALKGLWTACKDLIARCHARRAAVGLLFVALSGYFFGDKCLHFFSEFGPHGSFGAAAATAAFVAGTIVTEGEHVCRSLQSIAAFVREIATACEVFFGKAALAFEKMHSLLFE